MNKIQLEIPILLPHIPDEKDACIDRLIHALAGEKGIKYVHIKEGEPSNLCIHYDPRRISIEKVEQVAKQSGAALDHKYGHLLEKMTGVRHIRHARSLEGILRKQKGILHATVSNSGVIKLEWDNEQLTEGEVRTILHKKGLNIKAPQKNGESTSSDNGHKHRHTRLLGENTELYFAIGSGIFWILGLVIFALVETTEWLKISFFCVSLLLGGYFTLLEAFEAIRKGKFEIDFLMLVAAIGAATLGNWAEAALLLFLFSLGHALEHYAMNRARKSISALSDLAPATAWVKRGGETIEIAVEELALGDIVVIKPNSKITADGVIVKGKSAVNQAPITGESVPVDKHPVDDPEAAHDLNKLSASHRAFAGTINGNSALEIKVLKLAKDSTLSRLITLVKEAETQKSPTQHFAEKFERYFVPLVLGLVILLLFAFLVIDETFEESFYRAMAVLVSASPCALAISTPSAILAGVARAAREGVLIKGGRPLEALGGLNAVAFDKTGTLTEGKPKLTHVIPFGDTAKEDLLTVAIAVEAMSDHPLASAIVAGGKKQLGDIEIPEASELEALTARGIKAKVNDQLVHIGNRRLFKELTGKDIPPEMERDMSELEGSGHTAMIVHRGDQYLGIISVMDVARVEAKATLAALKKIGIKRMIMLTGDNQKVADAVAATIGITDPMGSLLPEDKVAAIEQLKAEEGQVAMVGDGVNDAPAMAKSTVGIAMGAAGSDVALETADIALMADKLDNLPFAIGLSRKARQIIKQNIWISLGMVAILVPLTISGLAEIGPAVVAHEGSTILVVVNALRLLGFKKQ